MPKHITIVSADSHLNVRGEVMFDPQEGTLSILSEQGSYLTYNWNKIEFFIVQACDECEEEDEE